MSKFIDWLSSHRLAAIVIAIVYYALVIIPHEWVGVNVNKFFGSMSRSSYDLIILIAFLMVLVTVAFYFRKKLWGHQDKKILLFYFALTLVLIFLTNNFLFVINIESVHYLQYAVGVILLFGLIGHYYGALFVAFLIALVDEGYQYFYLSEFKTDYFDFNDIITDFLGAVFGLLLLKVISVKETGVAKQKMKSFFFIPLVISSLLFFGLLQSTVLSIYPSNDQFTLVQKVQEEYWVTLPQKISNPNKALKDYLVKYPNDSAGQKLFETVQQAKKARLTFLSNKSKEIDGREKVSKGKNKYAKLIKELRKSNDPEFTFHSRKIQSLNQEQILYMEENWEGGIPNKYLDDPSHKVVFHVVDPKEGGIILIILFFVYYFCFKEELRN